MGLSGSAYSLIMMITLVALVPLTGAFLAAVPYLMPKRECFAVTVPDEAQTDPVLRGFKRRYAIIMGALTLVMTVVVGTLCAAGAFETVAVAMGVAVVGFCIVSYGLMLYFRSKVSALKRQRGWQATGSKSAAAIGGEAIPRPLSQRWDLLFLPMIVVSLAVCLLGYGNIPDEIPRQMGLNGEVTSYFQKSYLAACFPAIVVAFIDGVLAFSHWQILRSKKFSDPSMPAASAWAYGMFVRAQTMLLVVAGVVLGFVGLAMALNFVGVISLQVAALWCLISVMAVALGSLAVSAVYGQNGSRLIARVEGSGGMPRDNDRFWKLGIFYVNREDPSLFVPERFGIGWTMNWGRPAAWAVLAGLVLVIVAFLLFVFLCL